MRRWAAVDWHVPVVAATILALSLLRLAAYPDLRASMGTADTEKFVNAAQLPLFSTSFFTSNRPATIALVYKLLEPEESYPPVEISEPARSGSVARVRQAGFDRVVLFQLALSMVGWTALAIGFSRRLKSGAGKILGAALVLLFAYAPQLADWDFVLMSEPISFALFALVLGLTLELAHHLAAAVERWTWKSSILTAAWGMAVILWLFARDTNAYAVLVGAGILLAAAAVRWRSGLPARRFALLAVLLLGMFAAQNRTLYASDRWVNPFFNNLIYNVFPYPDRVAFFESHGIPVSEELLALQESRGNEDRFYEFDEFMDWTLREGPSTYTRFLIQHPRWTFGSLVGRLEFLFSENSQPYFPQIGTRLYRLLLPLGDMLHPTSSAAILIVFLLTLLPPGIAARARTLRWSVLAWIFGWLLLAEAAMLFVSFHGDSLGVIRHALVAVMPLRLSIWLLIVVAMDAAILRPSVS